MINIHSMLYHTGLFRSSAKWHTTATGYIIRAKVSNTWMIMRRHYCNVIMGVMASQITSLKTVYPIIQSGADQRKHQNSASLAFVQWPVNSMHKDPVTRKRFPFDDVIMVFSIIGLTFIPYIILDIIRWVKKNGRNFMYGKKCVTYVSMTS